MTDMQAGTQDGGEASSNPPFRLDIPWGTMSQSLSQPDLPCKVVVMMQLLYC